MNKVYKK